jgi:hypothetical protein
MQKTLTLHDILIAIARAKHQSSNDPDIAEVILWLVREYLKKLELDPALWGLLDMLCREAEGMIAFSRRQMESFLIDLQRRAGI